MAPALRKHRSTAAKKKPPQKRTTGRAHAQYDRDARTWQPVRKSRATLNATAQSKVNEEWRLYETGHGQLLRLVKIRGARACKRYRYAKKFSARAWRKNCVASFRYVPSTRTIAEFLELDEDTQGSITSDFLKRRLAKADVLETVKQVHPHLDIDVGHRRSANDAFIRCSQGPSQRPSQRGDFVNYDVEHSVLVFHDRESREVTIEVVFWGFLESSLNGAMRGWDHFARVLLGP